MHPILAHAYLHVLTTPYTYTPMQTYMHLHACISYLHPHTHAHVHAPLHVRPDSWSTGANAETVPNLPGNPSGLGKRTKAQKMLTVSPTAYPAAWAGAPGARPRPLGQTHP